MAVAVELQKTVPRVVIDARMVGPILHGIARYVSLMAKGLQLTRQKQGLPYEPIFLVQPNQAAEFYGHRAIRVSTPFLSLKELIEIPRVLRELGADLYHSPSFSSLLECPCPWIATIHDLNHLYYGDWTKRLYYHWILRRFARNAKMLMTVSRFSQSELQAWLGQSAPEIQIVYNALDPSLSQQRSVEEVDSVLKRYGLQSKGYVLCLSNSKPHKNVRTLVDAFRSFRASGGAGIELAVSIPGESNDDSVRWLGAIPEAEVRAVLQGARAVFFPSLYEGFGLPPVEAAALGISIAVSDIPPHREALVDLDSNEVLWVDPLDRPGWVAAFEKIAGGPVGGISEGSRGRIFGRYGYERLGAEMDLVYRKVLGVKSENSMVRKEV